MEPNHRFVSTAEPIVRSHLPAAMDHEAEVGKKISPRYAADAGFIWERIPLGTGAFVLLPGILLLACGVMVYEMAAELGVKGHPVAADLFQGPRAERSMRPIHAVDWSEGTGRTMSVAGEALGGHGFVRLHDGDAGVDARTDLRGLLVSRGALSRDGTFVVVAGWSGHVLRLEFETQEQRTLATLPSGVTAVSIAPGDAKFAVGTHTGEVHLFSCQGEHLLQFSGGIYVIHSLAFSSDGRRLAAGDGAGDIWTWDLATGTRRRCAACHDAPVAKVCFASQGQSLVSIGLSGNLCLRESNSGTLQWTAPVPSPLSLDVSADGCLAATANIQGEIAIWDLRSRRCVGTLGDYDTAVSSIRLSADGRRVLAASWDGTLRVWDVETGRSQPVNHTVLEPNAM